MSQQKSRDNKPISVLSANNQIKRQSIKLICWQAVVHSHSLIVWNFKQHTTSHSLASERPVWLWKSWGPALKTHTRRTVLYNSSQLRFYCSFCACCLCIFHHGISCTLPEGETGIFFQLFRWVYSYCCYCLKLIFDHEFCFHYTVSWFDLYTTTEQLCVTKCVYIFSFLAMCLLFWYV